jgi:hypothetical protein
MNHHQRGAFLTCACVRERETGRGRDLLASDYWIVSKLLYSKFIIAQFKTGRPFGVHRVYLALSTVSIHPRITSQ